MTDETSPAAARAHDKPAFSTPRMVELETEIAATRAQLAATVDELTTRLDPRAQADKLLADGKRMVADATDPSADPKARTRARVALGAAGGAAGLLLAGLVRKIVR